ncbi:MAG: OmpH family outer membrane protein [Pseudomonadota bacterium]
MSHFKRLSAALTTLVAIALVAPVALAQTKIIVIDQARIEAESKAGQSLRSALGTIEGQMQNEMAPMATDFQSKQSALQAKAANMTPEAMQADAALQEEAKAIQTQAAQIARERDVRATELRMTTGKASMAYREALLPVLEAVMAEEGADIILDASQVVLAGDAVDVTAKAIAKLDASTPTISVTRERIPQQQPQPERLSQ